MMDSMVWKWIGFGILILGWGVILWGIVRFFMFVGDEKDDE